MHIKENELCSDLQSGHVPDKPHLMRSLKEIAQATLPAAKQQKGWPLPPVQAGSEGRLLNQRILCQGGGLSTLC